MSDDRGNILIGAAIFIVGAAILLWLTADACIDDESERNDLGAPVAEWVAGA